MPTLRERLLTVILDNFPFSVAQDQIVERISSPSLVLTYEYWLVLQRRLIERAKKETHAAPEECKPSSLLTRVFYNLCNVSHFRNNVAEGKRLDESLIACFGLIEEDLTKYRGNNLSPIHFCRADFTKESGEREGQLYQRWFLKLGEAFPDSVSALAHWAPEPEEVERINRLIGLHKKHTYRYRTLSIICAYEDWINEQLEVISVDLRQVADPIAAILYEETRLKLEGRMSQLRGDGRGSVSWVEQRSLDFAEAKERKTKLKAKFLDLLHKYGLRRLRRFVKGYSVETAKSDKVELLQEIAKERRKTIDARNKAKNKIGEKLRKEKSKIESQLTDLNNASTKALELADELHAANDSGKKAVRRKILDHCHDYGVNRLRRTQLGYSDKKAFNDINELGRKLAERIVDLEKELKEKKDALQFLSSDKILALTEKLFEMRQDVETANLVIADMIIAQRDKAQALADVEKGIEGIKGLSDDIKAMNIDFLSALAEIRSIWEYIQKVETSPEKRKRQLDIVEEQIRENIALMMRLLEQRELLGIQREQIEKTLSGKARKGLKISCAFANFTFPLLLKLGSIVGGNPSLKKSLLLGGPTLVSETSSFAEDQSLHNSLDFGKSIFDVGVSKLIKDTGTGSLTISLSLGLAYGSDTVSFFEAGVALVYTGKLSVGDDRKFRASGSIAINGKIKGGHKAVLEAAVEADLVKDTTVFVFNDYYQWAAWLSLKWANAAAFALALGANIYKSNRTGAPTQEEAQYLQRLAEIYATESESIRKTLERIMPFMSEPVVRGDMLETMTNIKGSVKLGSMIGIEGSRERPPTKCEFYRRITTEDGGLREQENNKTKMSATACTLTIGNFAPSLKKSVIRNHPNPDNDGDYLTFGLSVGSQTKLLVGEGASGSPPAFIENLNEEMDILDCEDNSDNAPLIGTTVCNFASQSNLAEIEVNLVKYPTPEESNKREKKKWRVQYFRGVHTKHYKAEVPIPIVAAPGLKITFGAEFKLTRTYGEIIFPETMTYLHTVYNGFMSIPNNETRAGGNSNDTGTEKWKRFKEHYKWSLALFLRRLKSSSAPARREITDGSQGPYPSLSSAGTALLREPTIEKLEAYLAAYKEHKWSKDKGALWKTKQRTVRFSINPIQIIRSWAQSRTQIGKLQSGERAFGFIGSGTPSLPKSQRSTGTGTGTRPKVTGENPFDRRGSKGTGQSPFQRPRNIDRPSEEPEGEPGHQEVCRGDGVHLIDNFIAIPQFKGNWCWAACSQMMRRFYLAERLSQSDIVRNALGNYDNITYTPVFVGLDHETTEDSVPISFQAITESLPFVYLRNENHYVTVVGYIEDPQQLIVFNPLPVANGTYERIPYETYCGHASKTYYSFQRRRRR